MEKLLAYNILKINESSLHLKILVLIHELRIVTPKQIMQIINLDYKYNEVTIYRNLTFLLTQNLIGYIYKDNKKSKRCFFLTRAGHQTIGGIYTFPRVPEYNLAHHLEVTNYLIESLDKVNDLDYFLLAISERRQVYEKKDMAINKRGNSYHVADYILQFRKDHRKHNWHFEIELTLKSRTRYIKSIFPKYLRILNDNDKARLIYVSPSPIIKEELDTFKLYFERQKSNGDYKQFDIEIFERIHIFTDKNFSSEMDYLIEKVFN